MGKLQSYLLYVGPLGLVGFCFIAALIYFWLPRKYFLEASFAFYAFWISMSKMTVFAGLATLMKLTPFVPGLVIFFFILKYRKRKEWLVPSYYWCVPAVFAVSAFLVMRTYDASSAVPLRLTYGFYIYLALLVVQRFTMEDFRHAFVGLAIGYMAYSFVVASGLLLAPYGGFIPGSGRFSSYGSNPNQVAFELMPGVACIVYAFLHGSKGKFILKLFLLAALVCALISALLSGSRQAIFICGALALAPFLTLRSVKYVFLALPLVVLAGFFALRNEEFRASGRIFTFDTTRFEIFMMYYQYGDLFKPFGMLLEGGGFSTLDVEVGQHAHNAFIYTLHAFGFVVGGFHLMVMFRFLMAGLLQRKPPVPWVQAMHRVVLVFLFASFGLCFMGYSPIYPTFTLSFLFCLFGFMAIRFRSPQRLN